MDQWAAGAKRIPVEPPKAVGWELSAPIAGVEDHNIVIAVRVIGPTGRIGAWSEPLTLHVVPVPPVPVVELVPGPAGITLRWPAAGAPPGTNWRVFRQQQGQQQPQAVALSAAPEWLDTSATGEDVHYSYQVQALVPAAITMGTTTLNWNAPGYDQLKIVTGSADGPPLAGALGSSGTVKAEDKVSNGLRFFLVDRKTNKPLAGTTVFLLQSVQNEPPRLTANPNPIVVPAGTDVGTTTLSWNAPGYDHLKIAVGADMKTVMTGELGSSGSAQTGNWVSNGLEFFLADFTTGRAIAGTAVNVMHSGQSAPPTLTANPNPILVPPTKSFAESEISSAASLTYKDVFPPEPPSGLTAIAGVNSIELAWEPCREPDLKAYQIWRAEGSGPLVKLAEVAGEVTYSDHQVSSGQRYRYAVSASDTKGNTSKPGAAIEFVAP